MQTEAAHRGSKRFGMCFSSGDGLAAHGTVLEIVRHQVLDDGRLLVLCKGRERFELRKIVEEKPVLRCRVAVRPPAPPCTRRCRLYELAMRSSATAGARCS